MTTRNTARQTNATPQATNDKGQGEIGAPARAEPRFRLRRLDRHNWVVERRQPKGKWVPDGYFPKIEQAAGALIDRLMLEGEEAPELDALRADVENAKAYVTQAVRDVLT